MLASLSQQQADFWRLIVDQQSSPDEEQQHFRGGRSEPKARADIYRRMYRQRLGLALESLFPKARLWLGPKQFVRLGWGYLAKYPSVAPDMEKIGQHFASHLQQHQQAIAAELARFDWAILTARKAPNQSFLKTLPAQALPWCRLTFVASVKLVRLQSASYALCETLAQWADADIKVEPAELAELRRNPPAPKTHSQHGESVLVYRASNFDAASKKLSATQAQAFVQALSGATVAEICGVFAYNADPTAAAFAALNSWLHLGLIAQCEVADV